MAKLQRFQAHYGAHPSSSVGYGAPEVALTSTQMGRTHQRESTVAERSADGLRAWRQRAQSATVV
jgi:hypothetical protein